MAVVIRMKRTGRRNAPCYRISVSDRRAPRDGRTLDTLGVYDPISPVPELRLKLDVERAREWLQRGALPSDTVRSIFRREGVYEGLPARSRQRDRSAREKETAGGTRRKEQKEQRAAAKVERRKARVAAKRSARKAAAAESAEGAES